MESNKHSFLSAYTKVFFALFRGFCLFFVAASMAMILFYVTDKVTADQYEVTWGELALATVLFPAGGFGLYFFGGALRRLMHNVHSDL